MTPSGGNALALAFWPASVRRIIRDLTLVVAGTLILTLSAKINVLTVPVPITMQTFAVMALAAAYGSRLAVATVLAYLAEGFAGVPVFANTMSAGPAYFLGTTGGFLIGFVFAAAIVGIAADKGWDRSIPRLAGAMLVGDAVVFALGFVWLAFLASLASGAHGLGIARAWALGIEPFILADLVKIALAACAVPAVWMLVDKRKA